MRLEWCDVFFRNDRLVASFGFDIYVYVFIYIYNYISHVLCSIETEDDDYYGI